MRKYEREASIKYCMQPREHATYNPPANGAWRQNRCRSWTPTHRLNLTPPTGMLNDYEAVLIGAGPTDSCVSAILAGHGRRVLVPGREKFSRYHIGQSLSPFTFGTLARIGMIPKMKAPLPAVLLLQPLLPLHRCADAEKRPPCR
jgi:hypothetical protein